MNAKAIINPPVDEKEYVLVGTGYEHMYGHFDLWGYRSDEYGIEVQDVTLHGDKRSIGNLFSAKQLDDMSRWCERQDEKAAQQVRRDDFIDAGCAAVMSHRGVREFVA